MKKYCMQSIEQEVVYEVVCNICGNIITNNQEIKKVDYLSIDKKWNYFSDKDNEVHTIDICEKCYTEWIKTLKIPPTIKKPKTFI